MNRSVKSVLALIVIVCLFASAFGWMDHGIKGLIVPGSLLAAVFALLIWAEFRRDHAPDFLRQQFKRYFERDGLCFAILPWVKEDAFAWRVFFQNRYERPCEALIAFRPATRFVGFGRASLPEVRVPIRCDGGAFGLATIRFGIPQKHQGRNIQFEVIAFAQFPDGKGKMLRFRDGIRVGRKNRSAADTAVSALSIMALHPHFTHAATLKLQLPIDVQAEASGEITQEILWRPGDPETIE